MVFTDISPWPQASFLEVQKGNTIDSHYSGETKDHPKAIENLKAWSYQKKNVHLLAIGVLSIPILSNGRYLD